MLYQQDKREWCSVMNAINCEEWKQLWNETVIKQSKNILWRLQGNTTRHLKRNRHTKQNY